MVEFSHPSAPAAERGGIAYLPFEILSCIFTILTEEDAVDMFVDQEDYEKQYYCRRTPKPVSSSIGATPSLKPSARSLPIVCKDWEAIVREPINAHLYFIDVEIIFGWQRDIPAQISRMYHCLNESSRDSHTTSCDIYASFRGEMGFVGDFFELTERDQSNVSRLLLHSILALRKWRARVAFIRINLWQYHNQWELLNLLHQHEWPRLQGLMYNGHHLQPMHLDCSLSSLHRSELGDELPTSFPLYSLTFLSLSSLDEQLNLTLLPSVPSLRILVLEGISISSDSGPSPWSAVIGLIQSASGLKVLNFRDLHFEHLDQPSPNPSSTPKATRIRHMMINVDHVYFFDNLFHHFSFPSLVSLNFRGSATHHSGLKHEYLTRHTLPLLQRLHLTTYGFPAIYMLKRCALPSRIQYLEIETSSPFTCRIPEPFPSPATFDCTAHDESSALELLSSLDLSEICKMRLSLRHRSGRKKKSQPIVFPRLTELELWTGDFGWNSGNMIAFADRYFTMPKLEFIKVSRRYGAEFLMYSNTPHRKNSPKNKLPNPRGRTSFRPTTVRVMNSDEAYYIQNVYVPPLLEFVHPACGETLKSLIWEHTTPFLSAYILPQLQELAYVLTEESEQTPVRRPGRARSSSKIYFTALRLIRVNCKHVLLPSSRDELVSTLSKVIEERQRGGFPLKEVILVENGSEQHLLRRANRITSS